LCSADAFTPSAIAAMLLDLASALEYCHRRGVVHGAIGPREVRFQRGTVVLDGFCASATRCTRKDLEFMAMRNPTYDSPEFCRGERLDARSDIYGLGAVAYLCLAGRPAHQGDSAHDIIFRKMAPCPPLSAHRADIDPRMTHLVESTLAPDVRDRPQTASEFIEVLSNVQLR
jgi:serine/threonine-protein kinase